MLLVLNVVRSGSGWLGAAVRLLGVMRFGVAHGYDAAVLLRLLAAVRLQLQHWLRLPQRAAADQPLRLRTELTAGRRVKRVLVLRLVSGLGGECEALTAMRRRRRLRVQLQRWLEGGLLLGGLLVLVVRFAGHLLRFGFVESVMVLGVQSVCLMGSSAAADGHRFVRLLQHGQLLFQREIAQRMLRVAAMLRLRLLLLPRLLMVRIAAARRGDQLARLVLGHHELSASSGRWSGRQWRMRRVLVRTEAAQRVQRHGRRVRHGGRSGCPMQGGRLRRSGRLLFVHKVILLAELAVLRFGFLHQLLVLGLGEHLGWGSGRFGGAICRRRLPSVLLGRSGGGRLEVDDGLLCALLRMLVAMRQLHVGLQQLLRLVRLLNGGRLVVVVVGRFVLRFWNG